MIKSMTAYAGAQLDNGLGQISWEIRSVNHRYLDISLRLPEEFRGLESRLREIVGERISRGRIDAGMRFAPATEAVAANLSVNEPLAHSLAAAHARLGDLLGREVPPSVDSWLHWPGMIEQAPLDLEPLHDSAVELLEQALTELAAQREREGARIQAMLEQRLEAISALTAKIRERLPQIRARLEQRLQERLAQLRIEADPGRLEQELALQMQKIDIDEELDRLDCHIGEARQTLQQDSPVGRRLDFLLQEFNREANTLGSKSIDQRTSQAVVDLKVLIEQLREQVQNVE